MPKCLVLCCHLSYCRPLWYNMHAVCVEDSFTWPTESTVVIGVAAYCWTVRGPKAPTLTERFELGRVLEVRPAVQFTHKQLRGCHMAAESQLCP